MTFEPDKGQMFEAPIGEQLHNHHCLSFMPHFLWSDCFSFLQFPHNFLSNILNFTDVLWACKLWVDHIKIYLAPYMVLGLILLEWDGCIFSFCLFRLKRDNRILLKSLAVVSFKTGLVCGIHFAMFFLTRLPNFDEIGILAVFFFKKSTFKPYF